MPNPMRYGSSWRDKHVPRTYYVIAAIVGIAFGVLVALAIHRYMVKPI